MTAAAVPIISTLQRPWHWFALVWLLLGALLALELGMDYRSVQQRERNHLAHQGESLSANLGPHLEAINSVLQSLLTDLPRWRAAPDGAQRLAEHLHTYNAAMPVLRTINVLDAQGRVLPLTASNYRGSTSRRASTFWRCKPPAPSNPWSLASHCKAA